jgi:NTE family protein
MERLSDWLAAQPFTLAMSSGFFGFFAHAGVLEALVEAGHRPRRVVGSSAGALVAGAYAAGLSPAELARELGSVTRADFWDPGLGLGRLRGRRFRARLDALLGGRAIEDAVVPVGVVVHDVLRHRPVSRTRGDLAAAVHASCAVPGLFQPVWIDGRPFLDGGILDRPALTALGPDERTFHHYLVSRTPIRDRMPIPTRPGWTALLLDGLPRLGPFALQEGPLAYERARAAARVALMRPVADLLRLTA